MLQTCKNVFREWLELPDDLVLDFIFSVYFANKLNGDPVWGGLVGASGDTKTELLRSLQGDDILHLTNLTPKTLISGLRVEDAHEKRDPSLLGRLNGKLVIVKDLTPMIENRETRSLVLGQLRDAYDGSSAMAFGTGETKEYTSRFGLLFGVTPVIETCWPVINALGERFIYYRTGAGDSLAKVKRALKNSNSKEEMRARLTEAARSVLAQTVPEDVAVSVDVESRIEHLADLVARARTPVKRAGRTEEVEYAPTPEVGTRLAGQLIQLARGIAIARGLTEADRSVLGILRHVASSGIPRLRLDALRFLREQTSPVSTRAVGDALRLGSGTVVRVLEDLWSLGLVVRDGESNSYTWRLSDLASERLANSGLFDGDLGPPPDICTRVNAFPGAAMCLAANLP